ncbi:hypothetical protein [Trichoplusia ni ascovirus 2c]|uniref:Structural protein ORF43 n=1 Tax=Trichoplusia ni ascovirus 2c TaxID=328615 RepID=Y043_TNAVC|nr:hypothetical protein TNAV2c_gp043 [Trichoplusia ni ascovirus 2c]Q06VN8.1 RecName: Full=Structural protein ORF43 [Trichoplusia ni ascovirus 2c]ABF70560.1 hypothetical protein [Trichoplusia ni ascovirus 2c]
MTIKRNGYNEYISMSSNSSPLLLYDIISLTNGSNDNEIIINFRSHVLNSNIIELLSGAAPHYFDVRNILVRNMESQKIGASFTINSITFVSEYMQYFVLNGNENLPNVYIDERGVVAYRKVWRRFTLGSPMFVFDYDGKLVKFTIAVERAKEGITVSSILHTRVRILDANSEDDIAFISEAIVTMMIYYKNSELEISQYYAENLYDELPRVRVLRDSKRIRNKTARRIRTTSINDIRTVIPVNNYARQCNRLPMLVDSIDDVPTELRGNTIKFPLHGEGGIDKPKYVYCRYSDAPYPGMMVNNLAGASKKFPYLPCCYKTSQEVKDVNLAYSRDVMPEVSSVAPNRVQIYFNTQRLLPCNSFGRSPMCIEKFITGINYFDDRLHDDDDNDSVSEYYPTISKVTDDVNASTYYCIRGGVQKGPNSIIEAVLRSLQYLDGRDPRTLSITDSILNSERLKLRDCINVSAQELYDIPFDKRLDILSSTQTYLDGFRFVKALQYQYDVNIYIYSRNCGPVTRFIYNHNEISLKFEDNDNINKQQQQQRERNDDDDDDDDSTLVLPYHNKSSAYIDTKIHRKSIVIYIHHGTEATTNATGYPHVEYIMFRKHKKVVEKLWDVYKAMLPVNITNVYGLSYYEADNDDINETISKRVAENCRKKLYVSTGKLLKLVGENNDGDDDDSFIPKLQVLDRLGKCVQLDEYRISSLSDFIEPLPLPIVNENMFYNNPSCLTQCYGFDAAFKVDRLSRLLLYITLYEMTLTGSITSVYFTINRQRFSELICDSGCVGKLLNNGCVTLQKYTHHLVSRTTTTTTTISPSISQEDHENNIDDSNITYILVDSSDTAKRLKYNATLLIKRMTAKEIDNLKLSTHVLPLLRYERDFALSNTSHDNMVVVTSMDKFTTKSFDHRYIYKIPSTIIPNIGESLVLITNESKEQTELVTVTSIENFTRIHDHYENSDAIQFKCVVNVWSGASTWKKSV